MKLRDLPDWPKARKSLRESGVDPNVVAELREMEGDSLDLVEMTMALDEALETLPPTRKKARLS